MSVKEYFEMNDWKKIWRANGEFLLIKEKICYNLLLQKFEILETMRENARKKLRKFGKIKNFGKKFKRIRKKIKLEIILEWRTEKNFEGEVKNFFKFLKKNMPQLLQNFEILKENFGNPENKREKLWKFGRI